MRHHQSDAQRVDRPLSSNTGRGTVHSHRGRRTRAFEAAGTGTAGSRNRVWEHSSALYAGKQVLGDGVARPAVSVVVPVGDRSTSEAAEPDPLRRSFLACPAQQPQRVMYTVAPKSKPRPNDQKLILNRIKACR